MALKQNSELWQHFDNIVELGMAECKLCKQRLRNNRSFNLKQHLRKVHKDNSEIMKYFDNFPIEGVVVCKTCNKRLQNRSSNIRMHMLRVHNIELKPGKTKLPYSSEQQRYNEEVIDAVLKRARGGNNENEKPVILVKLDKNTIIRSILGLVIEDRMSLCTIGSKNMKSIIQPLCAAISGYEYKDFNLNEDEIERLLGMVANLMRNDFSNELHWRLLSLKIESDLNAFSNSFSLSAMFVDKALIQKRVLGIVELEKDVQLTADHIKDLLHKFNIDSNQVISAYWDNTKDNYYRSISNTEYLNEIQNFEKYPDLDFGDIEVKQFIGTLTHQCILDVLRDENIFKHFLECRKFVKFLSNTANGFHDLFARNNLTVPQLDSPWKWGSTYQMIQSLYDARYILENIKYEKSNNPDDCFNMDNNMWLFIEAFHRCLNIIQKSILKFYSEELNCGDFYAQWLKCRLITEKLLSAEIEIDSYSHIILTELSKSIEHRSHQLLREDYYVACLYLDPRFQQTLDLPQKTIALEYLKKLWSLSGLYNFEFVREESQNLQETSTNVPMDEDEDAFLNEYLSQSMRVKDTKTANVYRKIEGLKLSFQTVETNILNFWDERKQLEPELYALSSICFAIPATQNYCKSIYSDFYKSDQEKDLSNLTKENLLFIRLNPEHLTNAVKHLDLCNYEILNENVSCESESDDVITLDDDSNTASSSTAISVGSPIDSKTAIVHPITYSNND